MRLHELMELKKHAALGSDLHARLEVAIEARRQLIGATFEHLHEAKTAFDTALAALRRHHPEVQA